jgi:hypothetical protein
VEMKQGQEDIDMDAIGHLSRPGAPAELARVRALQMGRKSVLPRPHTRQTADYLCSTEHGSDGKETSQPFQTMLNNYMSFLLQQQQSYRAKRFVCYISACVKSVSMRLVSTVAYWNSQMISGLKCGLMHTGAWRARNLLDIYRLCGANHQWLALPSPRQCFLAHPAHLFHLSPL